MYQFLNGKGTKQVEIIAKDDKRQLTAVFADSATGEFLPLQLMIANRCLPHYNFPLSRNITKTPTHWSDEHTMKEYFTEVPVILPVVNEKRRTLKLSSEQPALL